MTEQHRSSGDREDRGPERRSGERAGGRGGEGRGAGRGGQGGRSGDRSRDRDQGRAPRSGDDRRASRSSDDRGERRSSARGEGSSGGGRSSSGERRPYNRDSSSGRDSERRPYNRDNNGGRDGERRPYNRDNNSGRDGERRPYNRDINGGRDGERRPYNRDSSSGGRDGERRPYNRGNSSGGRDGERRPYNRDNSSGGRDGERRPYNRDSNSSGRDGERRPYNRDSNSSGRDGERRPYNRDNSSRDSGGRGRDDRDRPRAGRFHRSENHGLTREEVREQERSERPGLARKADEPATPEDFDPKALPRAVRAELRGLPQDLARIVAAHLTAAGELIDTDPELALGHAQAARRRAARLPVVREATADAAHAAGDWSTALTEYRALHRMTGSPEYLPVMADCERALGRPREALKLAKQAGVTGLEPEQWLEMVMVEAGARADIGQADEGVRVLKQAINSRRGPRASQARLRYALADLALTTGDEALARTMFAQADRLDVDHELDADERLATLEGREVVLRDGEDIELVEWGSEPDDEDDELETTPSDEQPDETGDGSSSDDSSQPTPGADEDNA